MVCPIMECGNVRRDERASQCCGEHAAASLRKVQSS
jgi:hypothetical protein